MRAPLDLWPLFTRHGADFVRHAHLELLGREPEPAAADALTAGLLDGRLRKIELLGAMRFGPEGKRVGRPVPSLRWRFLLSRAYRLPIAGRLARIATALARMPRVLSEMQRLEQQLHRQAVGLDRLQASAGSDHVALRQAVEAAAGMRARVLGLEASLSALPAPQRLTAELDRRREHDGAIADAVLSLADRLDAAEDRAARTDAASARSVVATESAAAAHRSLADAHGELASKLAAFVAATAHRLDEAERLLRTQRSDLTQQQSRLGFILQDVRKRLALPFTAPEAERLVAAADHALDSLYVAFEDRFRGSREDIKQRQAVYLPLLAASAAGATPGAPTGGPGGLPVLDVGCGRGEWLQLLREQGLVASGVDLNGAMVEFCRSLGLDVAAGDAIEHLRAVPPGSLGAVTGFHIIEHLPFETFVQLLDLSLRALASGGVIVFETPNPDNVLVGSRNFYLDPTHRNPLPKEMTTMIAEARGFVRVEARALHPSGVSFGAEDLALGERLDQLFFGPQDYALIAWRP